MRMNLWNKGEKLKSKVIFTGSGRKLYHYSFKEINDPPTVTICYENNKTTIEKCTCRHCSIFGGVCPEVLCSYRIAVMKALPLPK